MPRKIEIPNIDDVIREYVEDGIPLQRLSQKHRICRTVLTRRLKARGIKVRSYSDGQRARWRDRGSSEHITSVLRNAWNACADRTERPIVDFIQERGFAVDRQVVVGRYGLDVALHELPVAVEIVYMSPSRFNTIDHPKRIKHILDSGWFVLFLVATLKPGPRRPQGSGRKRRTIDLGLVGDYLTSWLKAASRCESMRGHYWVIYGNGEPYTGLAFNFGDLPLVPRPLRPDEPAAYRRVW